MLATDVMLVSKAIRRGVRAEWNPPRYQGPSDALALAKQAPDTAREVLRRATEFRRQIESWSGGCAPLLALPSAPEPRHGACVSCGVAVAAWRCPACLLAVELALGLTPLDPSQST
jgi:hypothetical protein